MQQKPHNSLLHRQADKQSLVRMQDQCPQNVHVHHIIVSKTVKKRKKKKERRKTRTYGMDIHSSKSKIFILFFKGLH